MPNAFVNDLDCKGCRTDRHSVSRELCTSAEDLRKLAPDPEEFGVAAIPVSVYEKICNYVEHSPTSADSGHSDAVGKKSRSLQQTLAQNARILIPQAVVRPTLSPAIEDFLSEMLRPDTC